MTPAAAHAAARILERLEPAERLPTARALGRFAAEHPQGSYAVRVATLRAIRGAAWSDQSNGDLIVAIVRNGAVQTVMLRRSTQPWRPDALNVERLAVL